MIYGLNYANNEYKKAQKLNTWSMKSIGHITKVYEMSPEYIDNNFRKTYSSILLAKRGNGFWLWKPYFIKKILDKIEINDYLLYLDSGVLLIASVDYLIDILDNSKQDILCFATPFLEKNFCKSSVLEKYRITQENQESFQIEATYILIKKTEESSRIIDLWLEKCCIESNIADDEMSGEYCFEHRHDQALFSITCKIFGYQPYYNLSDRYLIENMEKMPFEYIAPDKRENRIKRYLGQFKNDKKKLCFIVHHLGKSKHFMLNVTKHILNSLVKYYKSKFLALKYKNS